MNARHYFGADWKCIYCQHDLNVKTPVPLNCQKPLAPLPDEGLSAAYGAIKRIEQRARDLFFGKLDVLK